MNNGLKKLALGLLIVTAVGSLAGCKKKTTANNSDTGSKYAATKAAIKFDKAKTQGKTIKVWAWWDMDQSEKDVQQAFTDASGATVEWSNIPWGDEYNQKVVAAVTANNGPDVVWFESNAVPTWINKQILAPLSDYIDFKKPVFSKMSVGNKELYTMNGKTYAYGNAGASSFKLYYRSDIIKNNGLEDPYELFKKGQWTWDKFFELGQELTQDTNGDGTVDQYGYDAWPTEQWFWSNGASLVRMVDGLPKFTMDEPQAIESLQALRDIDSKYKMKSPWDPNKDPQQKLLAGITAFNYWGSWEHQNFKDQLGDKLGFVSFPAGPSLNAKMADHSGGALWGISASSQNPELVAQYQEWLALPATAEEGKKKEQEAKDKEISLFGNEEMRDFAYEMAKNSYPNNYGGYGLAPILDKVMWQSGDLSPAQAVEAQKDAAQAQIDSVWNDK